MTDVLAIIEQTEPRVLPEAMSFVLTTLDDVQQLRARAERLTEAECRALLLLHAAHRPRQWEDEEGVNNDLDSLKAEFAARLRPAKSAHGQHHHREECQCDVCYPSLVEVWPNGRGDL